MKLLITGATGFMGRHLVPHLSLTNEVIALGRDFSQVSWDKGVKKVEMDLSRPLVTQLLPKHVDGMIHLAQANVPFPEGAKDLVAVNLMATQHLLQYARQAGVRRFVLASSGDVYGGAVGLSKETDIPQPKNFYGVMKYAAEMLAQAYTDDSALCILRFFRPYGPGQTNRLFPKMAQDILQRKPVRLHPGGRPRQTPIYVGDAVVAFERILQGSWTGVMNVAGDQVVTLREVANTIGEILNVEPVFEEVMEVKRDEAGDNTRMKEVLGLEPKVSLEKGLEFMLEAREDKPCQINV